MGFTSSSYSQTLYRADYRCPHTLLQHGGFKPNDSDAVSMRSAIKEAVAKGGSVGKAVQGHVMFNWHDSVSFADEETCGSYAFENKRWVYEVVPQGLYILKPDPPSGLYPTLAVLADSNDLKNAGDHIGYVPGRGADEVDLAFDVPLDWIKSVRTAESCTPEYFDTDRKKFDWTGLSGVPDASVLCRFCSTQAWS
jgi:hypothetical protein